MVLFLHLIYDSSLHVFVGFFMRFHFSLFLTGYPSFEMMNRNGPDKQAREMVSRRLQVLGGLSFLYLHLAGQNHSWYF